MLESGRNSAEHLPDPSAELVLMGVLVQAYLNQLPKKKRPMFLADVTDTLQAYRDAYEVVRIRPRSTDSEMREKFREAHAWWNLALGVLSRMGPPE